MNIPVGASDLGALLGVINPPRKPRSLTMERSKVIRLGPEAKALREAFAAAPTPAPLMATPGSSRSRPRARPPRTRHPARDHRRDADPAPGARGERRRRRGALSAPAARPAPAAADPDATPPPTAPLPPFARARPRRAPRADRRPPAGRREPSRASIGRPRAPRRVSTLPPIPQQSVRPQRSARGEGRRACSRGGFGSGPQGRGSRWRGRRRAATRKLGARSLRLSACRRRVSGVRARSPAARDGAGSAAPAAPELVGRAVLPDRDPRRRCRGGPPLGRPARRSPGLAEPGGTFAGHRIRRGAALRLDGVPCRGSSPTTVTVRRDLLDHVVEATLPGYRPARAIVRYDKTVALSFRAASSRSRRPRPATGRRARRRPPPRARPAEAPRPPRHRASPPAARRARRQGAAEARRRCRWLGSGAAAPRRSVGRHRVGGRGGAQRGAASSGRGRRWLGRRGHDRRRRSAASGLDALRPPWSDRRSPGGGAAGGPSCGRSP